ncbi:MAG: glycosyltransferase [Pseudomonadales bacterium]
MGEHQHPVRVCLVISNLELGGAERQVVQIANGLDKSRFSVTVVTLGEPNPLADLLDSDVSYECILRRSKLDPTQLIRLTRLLRAQRFNVVHGFLFDAEMLTRVAAAIARTPLVLGSERNADYEVPAKKRRFYRLTRSLMDRCIANSYAGARFNQKLYGLSEDRYTVVQNGVDTERFRPRSQEDKQRIRASLGLGAEQQVVGVFASMKEQKNHLMLIRAAERLDQQIPNVQYLFVGGELESGQRDTSSYARKLAAAIENSTIKSQFHLLGKRADVEDLYPCCDLTALPSWHEGLPNVLLESVACGVPVVATDVSDNARLIADFGFGAIVPSDDDSAMAAELELALQTALSPCQIKQLTAVRERISRAAMIHNISSVYAQTH